MRPYDIVSVILLIFSLIDLAVAAPVLVREKRHARVDVEHVLHDSTPVLGKRGDEIEKMVEEFFGIWRTPTEAHASSSSAPAAPDRVSTNVAQAPAPNQESSSTANTRPLMDPWSPSSVQGAWGEPPSEGQWWYKGDDELHEPLYHTPAQSEYGSDHELTGPQAPQPQPQSTGSYFDWNYWFPPRLSSPEELGQAHEHQQPNPGSSTDSYFDLNYWFPPPLRPASLKEFGKAHENQVENVQQPNPGPSRDSDFDWNYWSNLEDPPTPRPASPNEFGQAHDHVQQPNPGPSTDSDFDWHYWLNLEDPPPSNPRPSTELTSSDPSSTTEFYSASDPGSPKKPEIPPPPPDPGLPKEPEVEVVPGPPPSPLHPGFNLDHQSPSTGPQPVVDPAALLYAMKGKAKQSRHISGTTRDVENAA